MEFEISTSGQSFSSCALKRNTSYLATELTQHDCRKFIIKDQELKLYLSFQKLRWVSLRSCSCVTPLVQMHNCLQTRTQHFWMHQCLWNVAVIPAVSTHFTGSDVYLHHFAFPVRSHHCFKGSFTLQVTAYLLCTLCLMQLPVSAAAEDHGLLPWTWPDGLGVHRRLCPYRSAGTAMWEWVSPW